MTGAVFVTSARNWAHPRYYTRSARFENLSEGVLFPNPNKSLDALKNVGLYKLALCKSTDPILMDLAIH